MLSIYLEKQTPRLTSQDPNARPLAPETVETCYVAALCALYDDQAIAGLNAHPHPRGKGLKGLVERLKSTGRLKRGGCLRTVPLTA
jgi:hypothetical protein